MPNGAEITSRMKIDGRFYTLHTTQYGNHEFVYERAYDERQKLEADGWKTKMIKFGTIYIIYKRR
jgi:hypothetical protein